MADPALVAALRNVLAQRVAAPSPQGEYAPQPQQDIHSADYGWNPGGQPQYPNLPGQIQDENALGNQILRLRKQESLRRLSPELQQQFNLPPRVM